MATSKRAALYVRVSTSDRGQTVENQLQPLHEAAGAAWRDGRGDLPARRHQQHRGGADKRPGLDALLKDDPFGTLR